MTEMFPEGSKVETHSLTTVEYNALTGIVIGPAVEKNGVMRVPVSLHLQISEEEDKKSMLLQPKNLTLIQSASLPSGKAQEEDKEDRADKDLSGVDMKECRCMFCGEGLLLESQEAAVAHMEVCPCLQEQLNDTEHQFTLPQSMK